MKLLRPISITLSLALLCSAAALPHAWAKGKRTRPGPSGFSKSELEEIPSMLMNPSLLPPEESKLPHEKDANEIVNELDKLGNSAETERDRERSAELPYVTEAPRFKPAPECAKPANPTLVSTTAPWEVGYREALGGKKLGSLRVRYIQYGAAPGGPSSPEHRACDSYRRPGYERDLECCMAGFGKGLIHLRDDVTKLVQIQNGINDLKELRRADPRFEFSAPELTVSQQNCVNEFKMGRSKAAEFCRIEAGVKDYACRGWREGRLRHPACFTLGFYLAAANCTYGQGKDLGARLEAQGLYDKNTKPIEKITDLPDVQIPSNGAARSAEGGNP